MYMGDVLFHLSCHQICNQSSNSDIHYE